MRARMKEKEQEKTWPILQEILIQLLRGQPLSGKQTKKKNRNADKQINKGTAKQASRAIVLK